MKNFAFYNALKTLFKGGFPAGETPPVGENGALGGAPATPKKAGETGLDRLLSGLFTGLMGNANAPLSPSFFMQKPAKKDSGKNGENKARARSVFSYDDNPLARVAVRHDEVVKRVMNAARAPLSAPAVTPKEKPILSPENTAENPPENTTELKAGLPPLLP